jgi:hypothetical protein
MELFINNSSWQAKKSVPHTTVMFNGEWVKMCEDFAQNFGDKRSDCYITTTHRLTLPSSLGNFFYQKEHDCRLPPTPLFWFKIKLRDHHFDTFEMIEAESQPVKNNFREHDFQNVLKNYIGNGAYARMGNTSRVLVASRPKVSSWPDSSTSPGNCGWFFVCKVKLSQ